MGAFPCLIKPSLLVTFDTKSILLSLFSALVSMPYKAFTVGDGCSVPSWFCENNGVSMSYKAFTVGDMGQLIMEAKGRDVSMPYKAFTVGDMAKITCVNRDELTFPCLIKPSLLVT